MKTTESVTFFFSSLPAGLTHRFSLFSNLEFPLALSEVQAVHSSGPQSSQKYFYYLVRCYFYTRRSLSYRWLNNWFCPPNTCGLLSLEHFLFYNKEYFSHFHEFSHLVDVLWWTSAFTPTLVPKEVSLKQLNLTQLWFSRQNQRALCRLWL